MSMYLAFGAVFVAAIVGFVAGLITYTKSRTWCPTCGSTLTCGACARTEITRAGRR